jgi:hypothetical protein
MKKLSCWSFYNCNPGISEIFIKHLDLQIMNNFQTFLIGQLVGKFEFFSRLSSILFKIKFLDFAFFILHKLKV